MNCASPTCSFARDARDGRRGVGRKEIDEDRPAAARGRHRDAEPHAAHAKDPGERFGVDGKRARVRHDGRTGPRREHRGSLCGDSRIEVRCVCAESRCVRGGCEFHEACEDRHTLVARVLAAFGGEAVQGREQRGHGAPPVR
jgi:hypothetical protein